MRNNTSNKGFTLIELLIVIAIIGILAAVLIPNLLSARERAFDTATQACARSIVTAQEIYAIDYLGSYGADVDALDGDMINCDDVDVDDSDDYEEDGWTAEHGSGSATISFGPGGLD